MANLLRSRLIRLAHDHPEFRKDILPLLKQASTPFKQMGDDLWQWTVKPDTEYYLERISNTGWRLDFSSSETGYVEGLSVIKGFDEPLQEAYVFAQRDYKSRTQEVLSLTKQLNTLIRDIGTLGYHTMEHRYALYIRQLFGMGVIPEVLRKKINRANKQLSSFGGTTDFNGISIGVLKEILLSLK